MGMLTNEEKIMAWRRLHMQHPYGSTCQLCHVASSMRGSMDAFGEMGRKDVAGKVRVISMMVERRVIVTVSTLTRVFNGV